MDGGLTVWVHVFVVCKCVFVSVCVCLSVLQCVCLCVWNSSSTTAEPVVLYQRGHSSTISIMDNLLSTAGRTSLTPLIWPGTKALAGLENQMWPTHTHTHTSCTHTKLPKTHTQAPTHAQMPTCMDACRHAQTQNCIQMFVVCEPGTSSDKFNWDVCKTR